MPRFNAITLYLVRFAVIYGLLIVPWPAWRQAYSSYYQALGDWVFVGDSGKRFVHFEPNTENVWPKNFDTLIVVANRDQIDAQGKGPLIQLGLDTRQMGWIPTALFLALALASPLTWSRRISASLGGLLLLHVYMVMSLGIYIWNESTRLSLATLGPGWKQIAEDIETTVIANPVGLNLLVPLSIFVFVTIREKKQWLILLEAAYPNPVAKRRPPPIR